MPARIGRLLVLAILTLAMSCNDDAAPEPGTPSSSATATPTTTATATATTTVVDGDAPSATPAATPAWDPDLFPAGLDREVDLRIDLLRPVEAPEQLQIVHELAALVADERGLALSSDAPVYLISRDDLAAYFAATRNEADLHALDVEQRAWRLLGYVGPDDNLLTILDRLYEQSVIAFYAESLDAIAVVSDEDGLRAGDLPAVVHELAHAAQDQHADLAEVIGNFRGQDDDRLAYTLLIEGDARALESRVGSLEPWAARLAPGSDRGSLLGFDIPLTLIEEFNSPYVLGPRIVSMLGDERVDQLLLDPPESTEQLLHPEKLDADEQPLAVALPDLRAELGEGWSFLGSGEFGELRLRIHLDREVGTATAEAAAAGWGGDRYGVFVHPDGSELVVWALAWDTKADASEFWETYAAWLTERAGGAARLEGTSLRWDGAIGSLWAAEGDGVTWLAAASDPSILDRVLPELSSEQAVR